MNLAVNARDAMPGGSKEALALCQDHPGPIHLLLTDVVMPLMSGKELAQSVAKMRSETRVLYVGLFG